MQRKLSSMLVLAAAVALPTAVLAQADSPTRAPSASGTTPRDASAPMTFNSLDTNKDGHVSREEAKNSSELTRQFSQLDKDGDGKLSADELAGASSPAPSRSVK
jgi:hypothetical protein